MISYKSHLILAFFSLSLFLFSCGDNNDLHVPEDGEEDVIIVDPPDPMEPNIHLENHSGIYDVEVESYTWRWDSATKTNELFYDAQIEVLLHNASENMLKINEKIFQQAVTDSNYYFLVLHPDPNSEGTMEFFAQDSISFYFTDAANGGGYVLLYRGTKRK